VVLSAGLLATPLVSCRPSGKDAGGLLIACDVTPQPLRVGPAAITVRIEGTRSEPGTGAHVSLEGDMSHPGMAPVFSEAREVAPGKYRGVLTLSMGGDWVLLVHVTLSGGRTLVRTFPLNGVAAS